MARGRWPPAAHSRRDGQREPERPRAVPRGRDGRLPLEAAGSSFAARGDRPVGGRRPAASRPGLMRERTPEEAMHGPADHEAPDAASAPAHAEGLIVLLVDDQPIVAEAVRRMLASEGDIDLRYCRE